MISHHRQLLAKLKSRNLLATLFVQIPGGDLMLRRERPREKAREGDD